MPLIHLRNSRRVSARSGELRADGNLHDAHCGVSYRLRALRQGAQVLDVGTGTGVVAVTAARAGAQVTGLDLTPALLEHARENAQIAGVSVNWQGGRR